MMTLLLFHSLQITSTKATYFSKTYYHTNFQDPTLSGADVIPTVEDCMAIMLVLLIAGNLHQPMK
jgi:hypothetical protein